MSFGRHTVGASTPSPRLPAKNCRVRRWADAVPHLLKSLVRLIPAARERFVMTQTTSPVKKRGPGGLLVVLLVLILGGGAGVGAFWWGRHSAPIADPPHVRSGERGIVSFEPFVVNLADKAASRFLRTTIEVVVSDPAVAAQLQKTPVQLMEARSTILELLTQQTADTLNTPEGKTGLKKAIAERLSSLFTDVKVLDVLFSDFVIQF